MMRTRMTKLKVNFNKEREGIKMATDLLCKECRRKYDELGIETDKTFVYFWAKNLCEGCMDTMWEEIKKINKN